MGNKILRIVVAISFYITTTVVFGCETVTPQQVADALANAPGLNSGLQSCAMAAMAMKESGGGKTCAQNSCCVGILQLNVSSSGVNMTPAQREAYRNADLQTQVNGWVATANSNASSSGYQSLLSAYNSGTPINGKTVTPGMLAACEQFGASVCNHNVDALKASGNCGSYTDGNGHTGGQTICSWGAAADRQAASQNCTMNGSSTPSNNGCPAGGSSTPTDATPPTGTPTLNLPADAG